MEIPILPKSNKWEDVKLWVLDGLYTQFEGREQQAMMRQLLEHIKGKNYARLEIEPPTFSESEINTLARQIIELNRFRPLQYVLGEVVFCGFKIHVREGALIPRPETEELVFKIVEEEGTDKPLHILDIGTGSGCIAMGLKSKMPHAKVEAWDISEEALEQAAQNADRLGLDVLFKQVDVLRMDNVSGDRYDVIVSNPPYVLQQEQDQMDTNVKEYEPEVALFVPDEDPLLFYRTIQKLAPKLLKPDGRIYFEIHEDFGREILELFNSPNFKHQEVTRDLFNKDRFFKCVYAV